MLRSSTILIYGSFCANRSVKIPGFLWRQHSYGKNTAPSTKRALFAHRSRKNKIPYTKKAVFVDEWQKNTRPSTERAVFAYRFFKNTIPSTNRGFFVDGIQRGGTTVRQNRIQIFNYLYFWRLQFDHEKWCTEVPRVPEGSRRHHKIREASA